MFAIENPKNRNIKYITNLIEKGEKEKVNFQDEKGKTALMYAIDYAEKGETEIAKLLIEKGADVNILDNRGDTALMNAIDYTSNRDIQYKLIKLLIEKGADVNIQDKEKGKTILMYILTNYEPPLLVTSQFVKDLYNILITYGANINIQDNEGKTALIYALDNELNGHTVIDPLIKNTDMTIKDKEGRTALMYALKIGNTGNINKLIEKLGIETLDISNDHMSALRIAYEEYEEYDYGYFLILVKLMKDVYDKYFKEDYNIPKKLKLDLSELSEIKKSQPQEYPILYYYILLQQICSDTKRPQQDTDELIEELSENEINIESFCNIWAKSVVESTVEAKARVDSPLKTDTKLVAKNVKPLPVAEDILTVVRNEIKENTEIKTLNDVKNFLNEKKYLDLTKEDKDIILKAYIFSNTYRGGTIKKNEKKKTVKKKHRKTIKKKHRKTVKK